VKQAQRQANSSSAGRLILAALSVVIWMVLAALAVKPLCAQAPSSAPVVPVPAASIPPNPIAIVPLDTRIPGSAAIVTGALQVIGGRAFIVSSGAITSGAATTEVALPQRGMLRVCASTTVKLAADAVASAGESPGILMAMDHGAVEASFATGRNADMILTPDFRILIGAPGTANVKVRLGQGGDTCVDNPGTSAPYVLVTSVFDGSVYRVQPGQRVMFQHGRLREVVDQEKEPCGCPPEAAQGNDFPLAQSEGLAPLTPPAAAPAPHDSKNPVAVQPLVHNAGDPPVPAASSSGPAVAESTPAPALVSTAHHKKPGLFSRLGHFFRRIFGAE
jgi:hypothetical protein